MAFTPIAAQIGQAFDVSMLEGVKGLEGALLGFKKDTSMSFTSASPLIRPAVAFYLFRQATERVEERVEAVRCLPALSRATGWSGIPDGKLPTIGDLRRDGITKFTVHCAAPELLGEPPFQLRQSGPR